MPEKILIVDDDVDTLRLVGLMLQRQGYQIVAASNGHQALVMAQSEKPDLVLLDIMMPDMDGYEVTRRLRSNVSTAPIPIIMFTAKSQVDDKVSGFEVGADDYLTKPTQPRELFAHVKAVLARGRKGGAVTAPVAGDRGHVIGVLAVKGGLGVSTLASNLGVTLRMRSRKEIVVAEYRPGLGSISLDLGFTRPEGLNRLLQRKPSEINPAEVEKELVTHNSGVHLLMSSYLPQDAKYMNAVEQFEAITNILPYLAAFTIIDLGPGLPTISERVISLCDDLIVVLEPMPHTILRTKALIDVLVTRGFGEGRMNLVLITRTRTEMQLSWTEVKEHLGHDLAVAFTPAPELTYQASKYNVPIVLQQPDSLTAQQFVKLSETVMKHVLQKA
jgi:DNA-binding response OmpR family regulator